MGKELFVNAYDSLYWLIAVIMMGISILATFVWRYIERRKKKYSSRMLKIWIVLVILLCMYVGLEYENKFNEENKVARINYHLYQDGIYEQME